MKTLTFISLLLLATSLTTALPVTKTKKDEKVEVSTPATSDMESALEYERYLKEVVEALESDPEFRKKLDKAPEADIRSGKIAQELDYVNHHVRTKLDEIKRRELERLRTLANREYELTNDIDREHLKIAQHLDHGNAHTFEIEDLRKLIQKTSDDLAEADRLRRAEFKEYEMQKEFERESQKKEMDEEHRKKFEEQLKEEQQKHNKHEKVHHPGNKAQLEEVWEQQDHMDKEDFDPHTFFALHDVDSNGFWDETEVKALFIKELDKVYQSGLPEDDMRERAEEMERMREHVFKETDINHDGLISFQEFLEQTKKDEFQKDPEWETVDQQPQYTHDEYLEFERRRQEEVQRMIDQGMLPPHPNMPQGYYPHEAPGGQHPSQMGYQQQQQQQQMHYQNPQQQHAQQQQQYHQQQMQYAQHHPQQPVQLHPNQVYDHVQGQAQQHQQQFQQHPQQQQQQQYQQHPQQQQQQYQQAPPQQQQHQQAPPQQQQQQQAPQAQQVPQQQHQQAPQAQQVPQQQPPQPQQPKANAPQTNNQNPPITQNQQVPIQQQQLNSNTQQNPKPQTAT